jgi:hypothetical protein
LASSSTFAAPGHRERPKRRWIVEHQFAHQLVGALARPEDVKQAARLQLSHSAKVSALIRPRSAITHTRAMAKRIRSRSITGIRVVTSAVSPRPPIAVDHHRQYHLAKIGPMVFAVAVAAERLAAGAFEVQAGTPSRGG